MKDLTYDLLHETVVKIKDIPGVREKFPNLVELPVITDTIILTWFIMGILIIFAYVISKNIHIIPSSWQNFLEMYIGYIRDICVDTMGRKWGMYFLPFCATMFIFVWISNIISIIPVVWFRNPTSDLNVPISLAFLVFMISHLVGIKTKGIKTYCTDFYGPMIPLKKTSMNKTIYLIVKAIILLLSAASYMYIPKPLNYALTAFFLLGFWVSVEDENDYQLPNLGLAPLNYVGEISKPVSHACRLFGNIAGGGIIIAILSFFMPFVFPTFFNGYFGFVSGTIQAFIFTMLTIVYIGSQVEEKE